MVDFKYRLVGTLDFNHEEMVKAQVEAAIVLGLRAVDKALNEAGFHNRYTVDLNVQYAIHDVEEE